MTYEESDENWAKGEAGRDKDISQARERMSKPGEATEGDKTLMNKWANDVDNENSSPGTIDFVNAMKAQGGWKPSAQDEGQLEPPTSENDQDPCPDGEVKDCLGICGGGRISRNDIGSGSACCTNSELDCNNICFGASILLSSGECCDRSDADSAPFCCLNPIANCDPPCPKPGQIINGHSSNEGCWCYQSDENCCPASVLDDSGNCPSSVAYTFWVYSPDEQYTDCNCTRKTSENMAETDRGFASKEQCELECNIYKTLDSSGQNHNTE